ncbi:Sec-independent protein translocase, TatC subunit [Beutenbergia cavernae DSM 12333]|uniref:Sec-independent protein translocase protein TatC n=1 Tax=Beutenbergia cavernae (strain ATCC BAA-8 / DSM 12333 / CCUG 43141 / JCM 11478 / NBRC 16432 / NCIMB 13614 / HKI 0122) TaxID=471853 RepID=C5C6B0_BEUC1|nr:twin-arginine translocase subunit TatC [Beutenbergia cavernae]ACQ80316.1 Sec-independent protein translocase, TatC subunit [Beutenbergia cavernae DSM 12333]
MALGAHLRELRRRFLLITAGLAVGMVVGWVLYPYVFDAIQAPIVAQAEAGLDAQLNFVGVASAIDIKIKVSLFVGLVVSSPWWLYQVWAFIMPGLRSKEKRYAFGFVGAAVPLFLGGTFLAWSVLPNAVRLLTEFTPEGAANLIDASTYITFVMQFMIAFGLAFIMPLLMVLLTFIGIVRGQTWAKGWRWAVVGIFAFAAVATPTPDAISMILLALPICGLYGIALTVCLLHDRRRDRRLAEEDELAEAPASDEGAAGAAEA